LNVKFCAGARTGKNNADARKKTIVFPGIRIENPL
jgi:hypothetical protein